MEITNQDISLLQSGQPPHNAQLLKSMTLGQSLWLERIKETYLMNYLPYGGSKVKVLLGSRGSGKTHLIYYLQEEAKELGYQIVYLSAKDYKVNSLVDLYQKIIAQIDLSELVTGLCRHVAQKLGYGSDQYDGSEPLIHRLYEQLDRNLATKQIQTTAKQSFNELDLMSSFKIFSQIIIEKRMIQGQENDIQIALHWLSGQKLETKTKKELSLFHPLMRNNARDWLNSLIELIKVSGKKGLMVAIDDLEVLTEKDPDTNRYSYSIPAIKDIYELWRQLIDDADLLNNFFLLLSADKKIFEDPKRGIKSYEALSLRLETGLVDHDNKYFNPLSDIVNIDKHLESQGQDFPLKVYNRLKEILNQNQVTISYQGLPNLAQYSNLQARVIEAVSTHRG